MILPQVGFFFFFFFGLEALFILVYFERQML